MLKKLLLISFLFMTPAIVNAQETFWGFDDNGNEMLIPPECDGTTDPDELYETGMRLLDDLGSARMGASYCVMAAAFGGNVDAQYQIAVMYSRGITMPRSELAAYKWAMLAALNGSEEADRLGAEIEQYLSIGDIEASTGSLGNLVNDMSKKRTDELAVLDERVQKAKTDLKTLNREILDLEVYGEIRNRSAETAPASSVPVAVSAPAAAPKTATSVKPALTKAPAPRTEPAKRGESIFSQADVANAPMPAAM